MKNHFYMSYAGNKRDEAKRIYMYIPANVKTIIEPFCGTCAMSYYAWTQNPDLKFILNDNNEYLKQMYEIIKDDNKRMEFEETVNNIINDIKDDKEKYNNEVKKKNVHSWFIGNKFYNIRPYLFPSAKTRFKKIDLTEYPVYKFFKEANITFLNMDGIELYKQYKDDPENCILMDPPYLMLCNDFYKSPVVNIYEYLSKNDIKDEKAKIILILADNWIINLLYSKDKYNIISYDKLYQTTKRKTTHMMILNFRLFDNEYKLI